MLAYIYYTLHSIEAATSYDSVNNRYAMTFARQFRVPATEKLTGNLLTFRRSNTTDMEGSFWVLVRVSVM